MVKLGLLGAGRIGQVHARAVASHPQATLAKVFDPIDSARDAIQASFGAQPDSLQGILQDPEIQGVLVCTPSDQHAEQIIQAVDAGKAVFCEKPIAVDLNKTRQTLAHVESVGGLLMLGFQRRFDPNFQVLKQQLASGAMGNLEQLVLTSRDPGPPPYSYMRSSGGLFKDMMIHDFDVARWLVGAPIHSVYALGGALTDDKVATEGGDIDTASVVLQSTTGVQITILNSRRATYGYDQRIEAHCAGGMLQAQSIHSHSVVAATGDGYTQAPLQDFFMTRYTEAYAAEIRHFVDSLNTGKSPEVSGNDGLQALRLAEAASQSLQTGERVLLHPV